jgi:hypothetical protein
MRYAPYLAAELPLDLASCRTAWSARHECVEIPPLLSTYVASRERRWGSRCQSVFRYSLVQIQPPARKRAPAPPRSVGREPYGVGPHLHPDELVKTPCNLHTKTGRGSHNSTTTNIRVTNAGGTGALSTSHTSTRCHRTGRDARFKWDPNGHQVNLTPAVPWIVSR